MRLRLSMLGLVCGLGLVAGCCSDSCDRRPFWEGWFGHKGKSNGCCESAAPCCDPMAGGDMAPMLTPPTAIPPGTPPPIRPVPNQPVAPVPNPPMTGAPMSQPQAYAPTFR